MLKDLNFFSICACNNRYGGNSFSNWYSTGFFEVFGSLPPPFKSKVQSKFQLLLVVL